MIRSLDGRHVRQLTFDPVDHEDPAWSPDGTQIAFVYLSADTERIAVIPVAGGRTELISPVGERAIHPNWSPDGRFLAFASNRDGDYQIYVMDTDGTNAQRVAATTGRATAPKWSTDGRTLYCPICRRAGDGFDCEIFAAAAPARSR